MRFALLLALLSLATSAAPAADPKDAKGCEDSPLLSRFPGSTIVNCKKQEFAAVNIPLDKGSQHVEGTVQELAYRVGKGHTQLEIKRNFANALRAAGYSIDAGEKGGRNLVAHKDGTWIFAQVIDDSYGLKIITEKEMKQQVVASAQELQTGLAGTGHIVANGIFFDTGKSELKPESKPALDEIAKLLKQEGSLKIYVVGHTDNQGNLASNMELSRQRAASVVKALESQYGIEASRLGSFGAGPYAPVASNKAEDGRAKNRRVELVQQ